MKKLYLLILVVTSSLQSQNFQWVDFPTVVNGTSTSNLGNVIICDSSNNVYEIGFKDNYFYNSSEVYGNLFYRKYSNSGEIIFNKQISGKVRVISIASDGLGNIYLVAAFKNIITFESGASINTAGTSEELILVKFDTNGQFLWNSIISNFGSFNHFSAISTDLNNNVYLGFDNFIDSQIVKLSPINGNTLMTISQQNVQIISSLSIDNQGNIYAAGSCGKSTSIFAGVSQPTTLSYSVYAVKYNSTGTHQWTRYALDITCDNPQISAKTNNEIYLSSRLTGAYAFGSLTATGPSSGFSDDIFITKLNETGTFEWIREVPGTGKANVGNRNFLTSDSNGNVYFAGSTKGTTIWSSSFTTTVTGNNSDALILKYSNLGELMQAKTAGGSFSDSCNGIAVDSSENIFVSGLVTGNVTFDGITNSVGNNVPFIAKIGTTLNVSQNELTTNYSYPNPVNNEVYFSESFNNKEVKFFNVLGELVKETFVKNSQPINITNLSSGIYFVKTKDNLTLKLIKK